MSFLKRKPSSDEHHDGPAPAGRHLKRNVTLVFLGIVLLVGGFFLVKAGSVFERISSGEGNIFNDIVKSLPGTESKLAGEEDGRVNILLLGMRGEGVEGGGLLADTIMVLSVRLPEGEDAKPKASLISVPRDLYVTVPDTGDRQKINSVYFYGEQKGKGVGMEYMKRIVSEISGQPIHYAATIDFAGFEQLVDAVGGIDVTLDAPFMETEQFHMPHVCDAVVFTKPALDEKGQQTYECKYSAKPRSSMKTVIPTWDPYPLCVNKPESKVGVYKVMVRYPLCYNNDEECGGVFRLEAGENHLDGETALCYARSRYGSTDFDRARRQQEIVKIIKEKALSVGTLADFTKLNAFLDSLGDNARTDMQGWEMKRLLDLYQSLGDAEIVQKVLENSEEGLLYQPENGPSWAGYILLPRGDSYDRIHDLFRSIP